MASVERVRSVERDPTPLLRIIGRVAVEYYRSGFDRGGVVRPWSPPYGDRQPYVHIAGLVSDLARGAPPKPRRFIQGQAGRDTGALYNSLASTVVDDGVDVGSTLPYAGRFHAGGQSSQEITPTVRKGLADLLRVGGKRAKGAARARELRGVLGFLFARKVLVTNVQARPLVGWTQELAIRIQDAVRVYLGEESIQPAAYRIIPRTGEDEDLDP